MRALFGVELCFAGNAEQLFQNAVRVVPIMNRPATVALLKQRRFAPFFWTQFSGAANDNLFKFAFTVMVTYQMRRPTSRT